MNDKKERELFREMVSETIKEPPSKDFNKAILERIQTRNEPETVRPYKPLNFVLYVLILVPILTAGTIFLIPADAFTGNVPVSDFHTISANILSFIGQHCNVISVVMFSAIALCLLFVFDQYLHRFFRPSVRNAAFA